VTADPFTRIVKGISPSRRRVKRSSRFTVCEQVSNSRQYKCQIADT
jgi:hypothetical protein